MYTLVKRCLVGEMANTSTSSSSDCYSFINHTNELIINLSVYGATTSIGAVSALTAIVLILVAKAHKEFIYRLILYMAVDAVMGCLIEFVNNFENDYNIPYKISMSTNLTFTYMICVYCFLLCWLGLYLFSLAVFRVQLKKTKHEAIGLVTVLVTPLTFLWVFPWKTRNANLCHYTYNLNEIKFVFFYNIPVFLTILLSCLFIGAVLIALCKNAVNRAENTLQQQHRKAVRETIPFVVFMIAHQVTIFTVVVIIACQLYLAEEGEKAGTFVLWECFNLWPLIVVSLPILLACHPRIRRRIKCTRSSQEHLIVNKNYWGYGTTTHLPR